MGNCCFWSTFFDGIMGKNSFVIQFNRKKIFENKYEPKIHNCGFYLNKE